MSDEGKSKTPLGQEMLIVDRFDEHYGRWIATEGPLSGTSTFDTKRKNPLLLCACCLIAVRHTTDEYATKLAPRLFDEAQSLLSGSVLRSPHDMLFFQAILVLTMWSTTIARTPLRVDSWLLSGIALQHTWSSIAFSGLNSTVQSLQYDRRDQVKCCIWNHLCLTHLQ
jgi:hypothetical protein